MKEPAACTGIQDIRDAVNEYDRQIIELLGKRTRYVHEAVRFKKSENDIRRPGHIPALIEQRRTWAKEYGVDPDFVAKIYQILVDHSFDVQADLFSKGPKR
jgi:isochorismate pyruvate lyase